MRNAELARIFREIALYLEMKEEPFKPRAYEKVAYSLEALGEEAAEIYKRGGVKALRTIPGVGEAIAEKIEELLKTGRLRYYEGLKKEVPVDVGGLTAIEGVGPRSVKLLYEKLGIKKVADLEQAARAGKIRELAHFGEKMEQKILKGIEFLKQGSGRFPLGSVLPLITEIGQRLSGLPEVEEVVVAGSTRRWKETIGDADILAISRKPEKIMEFFVSMAEVMDIQGRGKTKSTVKLKNGMDVDLRVVPRESFGAALNYFTGSKDHNVALRRIAQDKGLKLNEYGLFRGSKRVAGKTEEELYKALGLSFIPPELRENQGEIEAAKKGELPDLVGYGDLRGDLQTQTSWTDGANSIEEMAGEAKRLGLEYIAITDHTKGLAMTGGSDEKKLLRQMEAIDKINRSLKGIKLLKGAEVNINKDGTLDIEDKVLAQLDVVGIAVHSHFNLPRREMTERIVRAMRNPHADILFHPTGRVIQKREPYDVDMDAVIRTAKETGAVLEIDAYPDRLDLKDEHVRKAVAAGVKLVIDSDAHSINHMRFLEFGVAQARRGWAEKKDVINTRPLKEFLKALKGR
ncbi:MAG: DNA polymerase/3'-5' exonuclease PolX [Deltaproteobacteria bacterium]|nr:DNA polymerase/3'-5' exonuclease PolX [Deltaproteobacteria bacterium]MBI2209913.1 DNA polymerase/3'-5' exonuclease PolX [Deltaproteobacteria bacterium]